ncbi:RimJ/RimL family protein N-acetyltransferase [Herbihabitans rhizosphaerae]|uniref:RimJ/RimL family protein N-acetyltransferase n=1 Tax=Herbihabitans rhizosphaerae TaxID=1872711 RepID=A0A4Q7KZZ8_9PSEU|nr:RimJ/RimL family protein N-acetyltransferase [Herbihabitans rhizosphaerae]
MTDGVVTLRRWRAGDADLALRIVLESMDHLRPWMVWAEGYDARAAAEFVATCERNWTSGQTFDYQIVVSDVVVGCASLMRRGDPRGMETGYWLHPAHTGHGYATTAAKALTDEAFRLSTVDSVEIVHEIENHPSEAVPRRLGFTRIGEAKMATPPPVSKDGIGVVWRLERVTAA